MLKEPTGNATCLLNTAHKSRDNPENRRPDVRQIAQQAALRLQPATIQVTLAAML
jgi:hypothetical protein